MKNQKRREREKKKIYIYIFLLFPPPRFCARQVEPPLVYMGAPTLLPIFLPSSENYHLKDGSMLVVSSWKKLQVKLAPSSHPRHCYIHVYRYIYTYIYTREWLTNERGQSINKSSPARARAAKKARPKNKEREREREEKQKLPLALSP